MDREVAPKSRLRLIIVLSSSLAAGFAAGSLEALQPDFSFKLSAKTLLAFVLGAVAVWIYWSILLSPSKSPAQNRLRWAASAILFLAGLTGLLYPLRYIAPSHYPDVIVGLVTAFCSLAVVAVLLLVCKRFLDRDSAQKTTGDKKAPSED